MVLRNDEGEIIFSAYRYLVTCYSPLEAELSACVEGLSLAMQWSAGPIVLKSDCLVATEMINDANFNRSHLAALVNEAKEFCRGSRECKVIHISREFNSVSHSLAKLSRLNLCTQFWNRSGPDEIRLACIPDNTMPP
jgi:ribonuclease HI